jgi:hypothetical protein
MVAKRKLGSRVSGNPAKRAEGQGVDRLAADVLRMAGNAWPFAYDYFVQESRIGLFADAPIIDTDGVLTVDLHGAISIPLEGLAVPPSLASITMVGTVRERDNGVAVMCSAASSFSRALAGVLDDITDMFVAEMGEGAGVDEYARKALEERPVLADPRACLEILLPLIQHPADTWPYEED